MQRKKFKEQTQNSSIIEDQKYILSNNLLL